MSITQETLKQSGQDHFIVKEEDGQFVMEPHCACGNELDEDFFCEACNRKCDCTFFACKDHQSLNMAEKLVHGDPSFKNFKAALVE